MVIEKNLPTLWATPFSLMTCLKQASAIGDRQMFPATTNCWTCLETTSPAIETFLNKRMKLTILYQIALAISKLRSCQNAFCVKVFL